MISAHIDPPGKTAADSLSWLEARLEVQASVQEEAALFLTEFSGRGVVLEDPIGSGEEAWAAIKAYFPASEFDRSRQEELQQYLDRLKELGYRVGRLDLRSVAPEDWATAWKEHFKPVKLTRRLVVRPPWGEYETQAGELVLVIYPGMAFGTGRHPSTWLCLQALEESWEDLGGSSQVCQALDVGTGSGILALAAARLGAMVLAIDIDPEAVAAARENILLNRLQDLIRAEDVPLATIRQQFDLIMANLTAPDLKALAESLAGRLQPGGRLIISGFLEEDRDYLADRFLTLGLRPVKSFTQEEWVALLLQRL